MFPFRDIANRLSPIRRQRPNDSKAPDTPPVTLERGACGTKLAHGVIKHGLKPPLPVRLVEFAASGAGEDQLSQRPWNLAQFFGIICLGSISGTELVQSFVIPRLRSGKVFEYLSSRH